MAFTTEQQESWQLAFFSLLLMSLAALLSQQLLLKSLSHEPTKPSIVKEIVFVPATLAATMLLVGGIVS
jgi:hypothetical protein